MFGVLILFFFLTFIENDYKNKCIDIKDKTWLIKNPELRLYKDYCKRKVVNMFSNYPCNCRQLYGRFAGADITSNISIPNEILELSLIKYNNLQGISIFKADGYTYEYIENSSYYFTSEMFEDLVRILYIYIAYVL